MNSSQDPIRLHPGDLASVGDIRAFVLGQDVNRGLGLRGSSWLVIADGIPAIMQVEKDVAWIMVATDGMGGPWREGLTKVWVTHAKGAFRTLARGDEALG